MRKLGEDQMLGRTRAEYLRKRMEAEYHVLAPERLNPNALKRGHLDPPSLDATKKDRYIRATPHHHQTVQPAVVAAIALLSFSIS